MTTRGARGYVLLVDDDDSYREAVRELLHLEGFAVREAVNGRRAIDHLGRADERRPCVILLDVRMPEMDGLAFHDWLLHVAPPHLKDVPVVFVTAAADRVFESARSSPNTCMSPNRCMQKPVDPDQLLEAVARHCECH